MSSPAANLLAVTTAGRSVPTALRGEIERMSASIEIDSGGGATTLKALVLADLIIDHGLERVVEIGVYRGRLLLPLGVVMYTLRRGEAVGIDPYSAAAALQTDDHDVGVDLREWPETVAWEELYQGVVRAIDAWGIGAHCRVVRARSQDAADQFDTIDLLHVDGNHDRAAVEADVARYLPKVRPGGFIVMDDASWPSVLPSYVQLREQHQLVFQLLDCRGVAIDGDPGNDFAVFRVQG
jgi:hypothetical protein